MRTLSPLVLLMFMLYLLLVLTTLTLWFALTYRRRSEADRQRAQRRPTPGGGRSAPEAPRVATPRGEPSRVEAEPVPPEIGRAGRRAPRLDEDDDPLRDFARSRKGSDVDF